MAITTLDGLVAARTGKRQGFTFSRTGIGNTAAGQLFSLYRATGGPPAQPAVPGAAAVPTKALTFSFANKAGSDTTYLDALGGVSTVPGTLMFYDRFFHIGGLNGTLTTAQAVNSQALLTFPFRGAPAEECEWFLEWYADTGATATTATVAVTYTDATTGTVAVALAINTRAGRLMPIAPPQGKYIASVQSVTLAATTGTAGSFGVTCGDRKAAVTLTAPQSNVGAEKDLILCPVPDDACLWQVVACTTTATGDWRGEFTLIQG